MSDFEFQVLSNSEKLLNSNNEDEITITDDPNPLIYSQEDFNTIISDNQQALQEEIDAELEEELEEEHELEEEVQHYKDQSSIPPPEVQIHASQDSNVSNNQVKRIKFFYSEATSVNSIPTNYTNSYYNLTPPKSKKALVLLKKSNFFNLFSYYLDRFIHLKDGQLIFYDSKGAYLKEMINVIDILSLEIQEIHEDGIGIRTAAINEESLKMKKPKDENEDIDEDHGNLKELNDTKDYYLILNLRNKTKFYIVLTSKRNATIWLELIKEHKEFILNLNSKIYSELKNKNYFDNVKNKDRLFLKTSQTFEKKGNFLINNLIYNSCIYLTNFPLLFLEIPSIGKGWLLKKGQIIPTIKKRFFLVENGNIYYYSSDISDKIEQAKDPNFVPPQSKNKYDTKYGRCLGFFNLKDFSLYSNYSTNTIELILIPGEQSVVKRRLTLYCEDYMERDYWVKSINTHISFN